MIRDLMKVVLFPIHKPPMISIPLIIGRIIPLWNYRLSGSIPPEHIRPGHKGSTAPHLNRDLQPRILILRLSGDGERTG